VITATVFFSQYQGEKPDYSDAPTEPTPEVHNTLEAGLAAFKADKGGHRRLLALTVDLFTREPQGLAMELMRV